MVQYAEHSVATDLRSYRFVATCYFSTVRCTTSTTKSQVSPLRLRNLPRQSQSQSAIAECKPPQSRRLQSAIEATKKAQSQSQSQSRLQSDCNRLLTRYHGTKGYCRELYYRTDSATMVLLTLWYYFLYYHTTLLFGTMILKCTMKIVPWYYNIKPQSDCNRFAIAS